MSIRTLRNGRVNHLVKTDDGLPAAYGVTHGWSRCGRWSAEWKYPRWGRPSCKVCAKAKVPW